MVASPPLAKGVVSAVGSAGIHSSDGLIVSCICMTKQTEEKQLPYPPQMPLKAQLLNRFIIQNNEAHFVRKAMCGCLYLKEFRDRYPVWDKAPRV